MSEVQKKRNQGQNDQEDALSYRASGEKGICKCAAEFQCSRGLPLVFVHIPTKKTCYKFNFESPSVRDFRPGCLLNILGLQHAVLHHTYPLYQTTKQYQTKLFGCKQIQKCFLKLSGMNNKI